MTDENLNGADALARSSPRRFPDRNNGLHSIPARR
jgi:hypothetical protein